MKKLLWLIFITITGMMINTVGTAAAKSDPPRIILYTYYRQMGWGDRVQIGSVDENGTIRFLSGNDGDLKWPYKPEEQLEYLSHFEKFESMGELDHDTLFATESLIYDVEDQGSEFIPAANDAGTEKSYAVRYSKEGEPTFILLGMSGDDFFENTNPNAQALYLRLRQIFPRVTTYAYDTIGIGPRGFTPVPLADFIGINPYALKNAKVKKINNDCEEGLIPVEMTDEETAELISLIQNGTVTGKADCIFSTGGWYSYYISDANGNSLGQIDLEDGLLLRNDGHYFIELKK